MRAISAVGLLFLTISSYAEDCEKIISLSKTVNTIVQDRGSVDSHAESFCKEYQEAKSAGRALSISASYKFLAGSFGSSNVSHHDVSSKYCSAFDTKSARTDAYRQYVETISPNAYDSYNQCIEMSKKDIKFNVNIESILPMEFSIGVNYKPSINAPASLSVTASKGVTCKWGNNTDSTYTFQAAGSAVLSCDRSDRTIKSFVKITRTNGNEELTFPWSPFNAQGVKIDYLSAIHEQNKRLEARISWLESGLQSSVVAFNSLSCPDGWRPYENAYGRFIRGIDLSETDSNKKRVPGSHQGDALQRHHHHGGYPAHIASRYGSEDGIPSPPGTRYEFSDSAGPTGVTTAAKTNSVGSEETRPKNVALLFCIPEK